MNNRAPTLSDVTVNQRSNRPIQLAGVALAIVWVVASLGQQWSWIYISAPAISCGQTGFVSFKLWSLPATAIMLGVNAAFHLKIGVRPGHPERAGSVIVTMGLAISLVAGMVLVFLVMLLFTGVEGLGGPPSPTKDAVNEVFLLGVFIVPPVAGLVSVFVSRSQGLLAKMGGLNRARLSFAISAGGAVLSLAVAYAVVAVNCGNAGWIVH